MYNKQRTFIPNQFLSFVGCSAIGVFIFCMSYTYKLFKELSMDMANPGEICEKINNLRLPEYIAHLILSIIMILKGYWVLGIMNFPFLFYNCTQWFEYGYLADPSKLFSLMANEIKIIKFKALFFIAIAIHNLWLWIVWVPPDYTRRGTGWNVIKPIQVSN